MKFEPILKKSGLFDDEEDADDVTVVKDFDNVGVSVCCVYIGTMIGVAVNICNMSITNKE